MAFTYTIIHQMVIGDCKMSYGCYSSTGGDSGGTLDLGDKHIFRYIISINLQPTGASAETEMPACSSTPITIGGIARFDPNIEIKTVVNGSGLWLCVGV